MDLWQRLDQSCVQLSIFGVLLLFGSEVSGLKSKLVNFHGGVSWVCHEFGRCLPIWFLICWKFVWGKHPSFRGPSWMKSYPNCQAKWCWVIQVLTPMTSHRFRGDSMWRNPWFFPKIQLNPFGSEKLGLKILPISISSEMTSFSSEG